MQFLFSCSSSFSSFSFSFSLIEGYLSVILQFQLQLQLTDETLVLN